MKKSLDMLNEVYFGQVLEEKFPGLTTNEKLQILLPMMSESYTSAFTRDPDIFCGYRFRDQSLLSLVISNNIPDLIEMLKQFDCNWKSGNGTLSPQSFAI